MIFGTHIPDVLVIQPKRFSDDRGYFSETWNKRASVASGIDVDFVQDNHSMSYAVGTVRGLHCQTNPHGQAKLVRCGQGAIFDVAVDIRKSSPSYGKWMAVELSAENGRQLYIPVGFLHGFMTLCENSEIIYKCSDFYSPQNDRSCRFDDPDIAIDWPLDPKSAILSEKDRAAPRLVDLDVNFE